MDQDRAEEFRRQARSHGWHLAWSGSGDGKWIATALQVGVPVESSPECEGQTAEEACERLITLLSRGTRGALQAANYLIVNISSGGPTELYSLTTPEGLTLQFEGADAENQAIDEAKRIAGWTI